jgi:hypothetical protein
MIAAGDGKAGRRMEPGHRIVGSLRKWAAIETAVSLSVRTNNDGLAAQDSAVVLLVR